MLDRITPVILTYNEEPNIARTLAGLSWANDIVVIDSGSTDRTADIVATFPHARLIKRPFDTFANQWIFATTQTGIETEWILAFDADYVATEAFVQELRTLAPPDDKVGYAVKFLYCVFGAPLRGTLYPPVVALFRRGRATYIQDGHTHRLVPHGDVGQLKEKIFHDDRKSLSRWLASQDSYMRIEAAHIAGKPFSQLGFADKIRRFPLVAPFAVFLNCYLLKGGVLDGVAGLYYALQRMLAEALLGLRILEARIAGTALKDTSRRSGANSPPETKPDSPQTLEPER